MSDNDNAPLPQKLTKGDVPELDDSDISPDEKFYCRHFEKDSWGYWKQVNCSGQYGSENSCASDTPKNGSYGWTRKPC